MSEDKNHVFLRRAHDIRAATDAAKATLREWDSSLIIYD